MYIALSAAFMASGGKQWKAFSAGFFKGYVFHSIWDHYVKGVMASPRRTVRGL